MMEKDCECIYLENNQEYFILDKIKDNNIEYIYMANTNDSKDICIRKKDKDKLCGLDSNEELDYALKLISKKNKDILNTII